MDNSNRELGSQKSELCHSKEKTDQDQRIRIRTDIFQSREFLEERADGVPMILPTPVPSIRNDMFKPIDEVICLVNVKDSDYNDNLSCKDLSNSYIKDIQGTFEDDKSLDEVKNRYNPNFENWLESKSSSTGRGIQFSVPSSAIYTLQPKQIYESTETTSKPITINISELLDKKSIDFKNGKYFCLICQIQLKGNIDLHLQGKRHVENEKQPERCKKLAEYKQKLVSENKISSRVFILIKEIKNGQMKQICSLCDVGVSGEHDIQSHLSGRKHRIYYERFNKREFDGFIKGDKFYF